MNTLLFCSAYLQTDLDWEKRCRRWFEFHKDKGLEFDQYLIVDNGSPELPGWSDARVIYDFSRKLFAHKDIIIFRFEDTVGDHGKRAKQVAEQYVKEYNFSRLINIESDTYIMSKRLVGKINLTDPEWNNFVGGDYGDLDQLPNGIDYAHGIDETWDDIFVKNLDIQRNYTYNRT